MDKKISDLSSVTTVNSVDFFPVVQGGTTSKLDFATLLSHLPKAPIVLEAQENPASGALSTALRTSQVTSVSGVTSYTLAAGTHGMSKFIPVQTMGGAASAVVTVTSGVGFTTLTFSAVGQCAMLENVNGYWYIRSIHGAAFA